MKMTFVIFLCTASWSLAQTTIILQGGIAGRTPMLTPQYHNSSEESWNSATSGVIGSEYFFTKSLAMISTIEYDSYPFNSYKGSVTLHDIHPSGNGEPTRIYRLSLEGKLISPPHNHYSIYLIIGVSYTIEQIGRVELRTQYPDIRGEIPSKSEYYWMQTFGLGWRCNVFDNIGLDLTGKLYSDYTAHTHESLLFGIFYIL